MSTLSDLILKINSYIDDDKNSRQVLKEEWDDVIVPKAKTQSKNQ